MPRPPDADTALIRALHLLVFQDDAFRSALDTAFESARAVLDGADHMLPYAGAEVPPALFEGELPEGLRCEVNLCRVFILRRGRRMETPENHRNSIQRLVSWRGSGTIHCTAEGRRHMEFVAYPLQTPGRDANVDASTDPGLFWDVVPMNTWHFPEAGKDGDWHTVTFHSAASDEIVDEYAAPLL